MIALPPPHPSPLQRYQQICDVLEPERSRPDGPHWLRAAAIAGLAAIGTPAEVGDRIRSTAQALRDTSSWMDALGSPARYIFAASLVAAGTEAVQFTAALTRYRETFNRVGLHTRSPEATLAALLLFLEHGPEAPTVDIVRITALFDLLKRHHWWLTADDDLPLCVLLARHPLTPEAISARLERTYQLLHAKGFMASGCLQSASALLTLGMRDPHEEAEAYLALVEEARRSGFAIERSTYESLAILSLLHVHPHHAIGAFAAHLDAVRSQEAICDRGSWCTAIAADLAVLETLSAVGEHAGGLTQSTFASLIAIVTLDAVRYDASPAVSFLI